MQGDYTSKATTDIGESPMEEEASRQILAPRTQRISILIK